MTTREDVTRRVTLECTALWCIAALALCLCHMAEAARAEETSSRSERSSAARTVPLSLDGGASVHPTVVEAVADGTLGLPPEDAVAYFRTLRLTEEVSTEVLEQYAEELQQDRRVVMAPKPQAVPSSTPFLDLFRHPTDYRGQPVRMRGIARRVVRFDPGPNPYGYTALYEAWVYPADGAGNPVVVVFHDRPPGLPIGIDLAEQVEFVGYFLKLYGYPAADGPRQAPLCLAYDLGWFPAATLDRRDIAGGLRRSGPRPWMYLCLMVVTWLGWTAFRRAERRLRDKSLVRRWYGDTSRAGDFDWYLNSRQTPVHH